MPPIYVESIADEASNVNLPKLQHDTLIRAGSMFLFDFLNPYCNPYADGLLQLNSTFNNMVYSQPATAIITTGSYSNNTGKTGLIANNTSAKSLYLGVNNGDFNPADTSNEILIIWWFKLASDYTSTAYQPMVQFGPGTSSGINDQYRIDSGADGKSFRGQFGTGSTVTNFGYTMNANTVYQMALSVKPNNYYAHYLNGVRVTNIPSTTVNVPALRNITGQRAYFASNTFKGTTYRIYGENITLSQANDSTITALAQVQADYAANSARFT